MAATAANHDEWYSWRFDLVVNSALSRAYLLIFLSLIAARLLLLKSPPLYSGIVAWIVAPVEEVMDEPVFDDMLPVIVGPPILLEALTLSSATLSWSLAESIRGWFSIAISSALENIMGIFGCSGGVAKSPWFSPTINR